MGLVITCLHTAFFTCATLSSIWKYAWNEGHPRGCGKNAIMEGGVLRGGAELGFRRMRGLGRLTMANIGQNGRVESVAKARA